MSPVVDGDLVIVSAPMSNWGAMAGRAHRLMALDKHTGDIIYVAAPGGRPFDTAYASPIITTIDGMRMLITGLGNGAVHAIKPQTGETLWSFPAARRAINTGVVVRGNDVIVSHGDENLEGNELGMIASIDGSQRGDGTHRYAEQQNRLPGISLRGPVGYRHHVKRFAYTNRGGRAVRTAGSAKVH